MLSPYLTKLSEFKKKSLHRKTKNSNTTDSTTIQRNKRALTSFCCNDYLGLSHHPRVKEAAISAVKKYGVGSRSSRYITGNNQLYNKLEKAIAQHKNCDDAIIFSSGYASSIGIIPALVENGDLVLADHLIHSCLLDGARLSQAKLIRFKHNSITHCEKILTQQRKNFNKCLIVTETIFSMDGDAGEVLELLKLAEKFNCLLISDDAHGLYSSVDSDAVTKKRYYFHLKMGTFSKALGSLGGYVAGDKVLIDYLRNFAKSAIYSTALPPSILAASLASLKIATTKNKTQNLAEKAIANAQYFCKLMNIANPQSAIVVMVLGDSKKVLQIAKKVEEKGFLIGAIRPPTVPPNSARLRLTFSAKHRKSQIKNLAQVISHEIKLIK